MVVSYSDDQRKLKDMQIPSKKLVFNLAKNATKFLPAATSTSTIRNYKTRCEARPVQKLLRYQVNPLEDTIEKYLQTVKPFLTSNELEQTKKQAEEFAEGCGKELQILLLAESGKSKSWFFDRWLKTAYLQYREPVMIYSSPGMTFPHQIFCSDKEFCNYTAKVIFGMLKYKEIIEQHKIPVVKMGPNELDNSQFYKVFGTCRIPLPEEDKLSFNPDSKHIVVICRNRFYKLKIYSSSGAIMHPDLIESKLMQIWNDQLSGCPVGILSADDRDNWAKNYEKLKESGNNSNLLKIIENSLFTVSLDELVPVNHPDNANEVVSEQLIHGGGSKFNAGNRWFDKTIQVIVNRNGVNGFCYEHSPAEGQPIAMMDDFVVSTLKENEHFYKGSATNDFEPHYELKFETTGCIPKMIKEASERVDKLAADLHMKVLHYQGYGKEFCKEQRLGPDSFCQMAMQYAFYKQHKVPAAQYESAHLRVFYDGRTETIRSCSSESVAFAKAMLESNDNDLRAKLLREAVQNHQNYAKMALMGNGVDRHLLGLKLMAIENDLEVPDFLRNKAFASSCNWRMSTSQVASANKAFMCYGPSVRDGYGCCYNPRSNDMFFAISSWRSNPDTDSEKFHDTLKRGLDEMRDVLVKSTVPPKSKL